MIVTWDEQNLPSKGEIMLTIYARNDDGVRLKFVFVSPEEFVHDICDNDDCMGDHEILLVVMDGMALYSSLGVKKTSYNYTLRTMDVYDWFKESNR